MPTYRAPIRDMQFIVNEVLDVSRYSNLPGMEEATPDLVSAIFTEAGKLAEEVLAPLNQSGDEEGCTRHEDGSVTTPKGFKEAYDQYAEGGWVGAAAPVEYGGMGLPHVMTVAMEEVFVGANLSFNMYPGLTQGVMAALNIAGSDEQKEAYLPRMTTGEWAGTMNLTEPHCGTDLGLLRTKAEPQEGGSYKITGTKIFISAGEQDLTDNIIHLVLARAEGSPEGVKGISLFIVPKFLINEDGTLGERNGVSCGSIEEKMGIHGNATCVLNYDGATGYMVGEQDKGLKAMFIMMNAARLGVGMQGLGLSEVSYQNAADYARDRVQGRALKRDPENTAPADPIIVHPDVRRMLMDARAFNEGARALAFWTGLQLDLARKSQDEESRQQADDLVGLMTPIIKGVFTDKGFENATNAQQVLGGHGYIREWGMEQFVRDARITMIYEGTNGIQALDLVGRKLPANGGRAIRAYGALIEELLKTHGENPEMTEFVEPLAKSAGHLQRGVMWLVQNGMSDPNNAGAGATAFMHLMGLIALGHMWLEMIATAKAKLAAGADDAEYYENKIITGRYFFTRMLPATRKHLGDLEAGAETMMALAADAF